MERSTYYYSAQRPEQDSVLIRQLHDLSRANPRYGVPRITELLRGDGWRINPKRVRRLWRQEGLRVWKKHRKRAPRAAPEPGRSVALFANHVWSWDFVLDRTLDGKPVRILNILDEYSRFNITLKPRRSFRGEDVKRTLGQAMLRYGIPGVIRSDNGPEFISQQIKEWIVDTGARIEYIDPGSPWQNGFVESMNDKLRDECLNREAFYTVQEMAVVLGDWREHYNTRRPHGGIDFQTPARVYDRQIPNGSLRSPLGILEQQAAATQPREHSHSNVSKERG